MFDEKLLKKLDNCAYNRPDVIPNEISGNDKAIYRLYFRFMCCVYMLFRKGVLDKEALTEIKKNFISDLSLYNVLYRSMLLSARQKKHLNDALIACNKNKDNCPVCMKIYIAQTGYIPEENESDIEV